MKICVFGAGAIGGHFAARLHKGGADVSVIARGANLEAIASAGLTVHAPDGEIVAPVRAVADPKDLGPQDAVLVTVKAPALPAVAATIGPLLQPETKVIFAMNGIPWFYFHGVGGAHEGRRIERLDPDGALMTAIGSARAASGVVYSACTVTAPGVVEVESVRSRLVLGEPDGQSSAPVEAVAEILRAGGVVVEVTPRIRDAIWAKLLINLASGPLAVLTGSPPSLFFAEARCRDLARLVVAEAAAIATALGCTVAPDVEAQIRNGSKMMHKSSILQDLELGRPMEIDALHTVPLELARMLDVPTPTLDSLAALVRVRARAAGLYAG
jgi:2-dehydropantoate 2-reductase